MSTTPQDRLAQLFTGQPRPAPPFSGQPHFSDKEMEQKEAQERQGWNIPSTAQYPRQVTSPPKVVRNVDCLTSSDDEDDYVSAFKNKPSMKPPTKQPSTRAKPRVMPEPNAFGYPQNADIESKGPIEYVANGKGSSKHKSKASEAATPDSDHDVLPTSNMQGFAVTGHYCQLHLVAKFPYKYMNDSNDRVSRHFFANNKFYDRTWDIYYLDPPYTLSAKPIILVPFAQVQQLITEISQAFKVPVSVPNFPFTVTFYADGTPQPKLLGTSKSRAESTALQSSIPPTVQDHGEYPPSATSEIRRQFDNFKQKCEEALVAGHKSKGGNKKKKENDRLLTIRDWYSQLRRAQRYLGLRPRSGKIPPPDPNLPWAEQEAARLHQMKKAHLLLDPFDVNKSVPYPFDKEPVIISVDVESYERAHNLITEIGVSTLDTLDIKDIPPGPAGRNWIGQIRSRHFRIKERVHLVNKDFCIGNPEDFQFGQSELVDLKQAPGKVDSCFEWPFSVQYKHAGLQCSWTGEPVTPTGESSASEETSKFGGVGTGPTNMEQNNANIAAIANVLQGIGDPGAIKHALELANLNQSPDALQRGPTDRKILILGQDIQGDVEYLRNLGSKIFAPSRGTYPIAAMEMMGTGEGPSKTLASILEALDTAPLYRVLKKETQNRSLGSILGDLGLTSCFLHNAGNDARFTLEALIAMVVKARLEDDELPNNEKKRESTKEGREPHNTPSNLDGASDACGWEKGASSLPLQPHGAHGVFATSLPTKEDLDDYERAILASSDSEEANLQRQKDQEIIKLAARLKMDAGLDDEEPIRPFRVGRGGK